MEKVLAFFEETIPAYLIIFASLLVFTEAFLRYVFGHSFIWAEELARYLIICFIFFGSSYAVRKGSHATVDVVVTYLPGTLQRMFNLVAYLLSLAFTLLISYVGFNLVAKIKVIGNVTPAMAIPMYLPYLIIPIGSLMMSIRYVQQIFKTLRKTEEA